MLATPGKQALHPRFEPLHRPHLCRLRKAYRLCCWYFQIPCVVAVVMFQWKAGGWLTQGPTEDGYWLPRWLVALWLVYRKAVINLGFEHVGELHIEWHILISGFLKSNWMKKNVCSMASAKLGHIFPAILESIGQRCFSAELPRICSVI